MKSCCNILISENISLTNQRVDNLSKYISDLKECLEFSQNEYDDKLKSMDNKAQKLEEEISLMKQELHIIQATNLSRAIETGIKLVDLQSFT